MGAPDLKIGRYGCALGGGKPLPYNGIRYKGIAYKGIAYEGIGYKGIVRAVDRGCGRVFWFGVASSALVLGCRRVLWFGVGVVFR